MACKPASNITLKHYCMLAVCNFAATIQISLTEFFIDLKFCVSIRKSNRFAIFSWEKWILSPSFKSSSKITELSRRRSSLIPTNVFLFIHYQLSFHYFVVSSQSLTLMNELKIDHEISSFISSHSLLSFKRPFLYFSNTEKKFGVKYQAIRYSLELELKLP